MADLGTQALGAGFELLWLSRLPYLIRRLSKARGIILSLNRVLPGDLADFAPNAALQIRPDFLEFAIVRLRQLGLDIVDLDEAVRRLELADATKPFVVLTFDDAYRDNLKHALPILRRLQCPFALYVPTALVDGIGEAWWLALEEIIAGQNALAVTHAGGETEYFATANVGEKNAAYQSLYRRMRGLREPDRVKLLRDLATQYGFDLETHCRETIMDWSELRNFAADQLCTIGTRTVHRYELAKLAPADVRSEIEQSIRIIKAQFGKAPAHLSYPIGDAAAAGPREFGIARDLGLRSAVTSQPGGLYPADRYNLHALPRVALSGLLQQKRYIDVFATPAIFSMLPRKAA